MLPGTDERLRQTVLAVEAGLTENGFVVRYRTEETDDALSGKEGTFLDLVYHESCVELAGESPATVMTKQPCSWWAVVGETRMPKPHDKVAFKGGEQARGPYDEESCASAVRNPA